MSAPATASPGIWYQDDDDTIRAQVVKIAFPRALPRTPLPLDIADTFDDADAWFIIVPSDPSTGTSTSTSSSNIGTELSPPRILETPMNAYSAYDPVDLIIDCATLPSPLLSSFLPGRRRLVVACGGEIRSRWSCSNIASLAAGANAKTPKSPSVSEKLRFHLGSVARRVRAHRVGGDVAVPKTHARAHCHARH